MKKLCLLLLLLFVFSVSAQEETPLLLYTRSENDVLSLHLWNANSGDSREIIETLPAVTIISPDVGWSPDGQIWAVDRTDEYGDGQLRFIAPETGDETVFGAISSTTCSSALSWSPDGRFLAYAMPPTSGYGKNELAIYDFFDESLSHRAWNGAFPDWSSDGQYAYFTNYTDDFSSLFKPDGTFSYRFEAANRNFIFAPDSRYFAYKEDSWWLFDLNNQAQINLELAGTYVQWSPSGRYLVAFNAQEEFAYYQPQFVYDTESEATTTIALDTPIIYAGWSEDESQIYLRAGFEGDAGYYQAQRIIAYHLSNAETETVFELENANWMGDLKKEGGYLVLPYANSSEDDLLSETRLWFGNGESSFTQALTYTTPPSFVWSPDKQHMVFAAGRELYHFDPNTATLDVLAVSPSSFLNPLWSNDSHYLAVQSGTILSIWDIVGGTSTVIAEDAHAIVGWQFSEVQNTLLCPYGYGDGDV